MNTFYMKKGVATPGRQKGHWGSTEKVDKSKNGSTILISRKKVAE